VKPYSGSTMSIALLMKAAAMPMPPRSGNRPPHDEVPSAGEESPAEVPNAGEGGDAIAERNSQADTGKEDRNR
jgi:hypothetical protein